MRVPDTSRDGRAGGAPLTPKYMEGASQWHFWYLFYGGASQVYVKTIGYNRQLGLREISITWEPAHSK
jgi:hypothetical protein